jgi:hypothetical protein
MVSLVKNRPVTVTMEGSGREPLPLCVSAPLFHNVVLNVTTSR